MARDSFTSLIGTEGRSRKTLSHNFLTGFQQAVSNGIKALDAEGCSTVLALPQMPATKKERAVIKAAIHVYKHGLSNTGCVPYRLARAVEELGKWK